jgi:hypothetical protein
MHSLSCASARWSVRGRKSTVNFCQGYCTDVSLDERSQKMSEGTNLGVGNEESDSATDETPQNETGAGDAKRKKEGAPDTEEEAGVG